MGYENICIDPNEEISPIKQFSYFSKNFDLECETDFGKNFVDERYKKIYSFDKYEFYRDNGLLPFLKKLPTFSSYSLKYNLDLFSVPYFHFSSECFKKLKSENILEKIDVIQYLFSETNSKFKFFVIFSIVVIAFVLGISCFLFFLRFKFRKNDFVFFGFLGFCVFLVLVVLCFILYLFIKDIIKVDFLNLMDDNCGDFYINEIIEEKKNIFGELRDFYIVMISLFLSVIFFLEFIYVYIVVVRRN